MSFALESKKRKFDRILESITDNTSIPPRVSLESKSNGSRTSLVRSSPASSLKRRKFDAMAPNTPTATSHFVPGSQASFLERLETFRDVTEWHISANESIKAANWARRGWRRVATDTVGCSACKQHLLIDFGTNTSDETERIVEEDLEESVERDRQIHDGIVARFAQLIITAHAETCPWRRRGCDSTIQRIEGLLNTREAIAALQKRYDSIMLQYDKKELPDVSLPDQDKVNLVDLQKFRFDEKPINMDALKLAIGGWQAKITTEATNLSPYDVVLDTLECKHCFRSLGMWLYRGPTPTMDSLDVINEHWEYCPWRSSEAQTTQLDITRRSTEDSTADSRTSTATSKNSTGLADKRVQAGKEEPIATSVKVQVPAWLLVCIAISKDNIRASRHQPIPELEDTGIQEMASTETRDKKNKDLARRIRELRKSFNVKSLLRRNTNKDKKK